MTSALAAIVALAALRLTALPAPVAVPDAGLEDPAAWTATPRGGEVARDEAVRHGGAASLRVAHAGLGRTTLLSRPVRLEVGRFYRLSAWIRTRAVRSDPEARYPTALPACVAMDSFPAAGCSPAAGGTRDFSRVELVFVALAAEDRVALHLGRGGGATGTAWFDDVALEEVAVTEAIPLAQVRWAGRGFRYDDRGWIVLHLEGEPHARGVQHGTLVWEELVEYARKLSVQADPKDPAAGWNRQRLLADALFLRKFDEEWLLEMKGIAAGAAAAGAKIDGRPVDLLDVVTLNSAVDTAYLAEAVPSTPHPLTGRSFLSAEEELALPDRTHKCSALAATGPATADGRPVFGQLFMWGGYTGVHFNVVADLVPTRGHRLVYQTFPGGIHSGTDFYMNGAGLVIGETTVLQTPFEPSGRPQASRIRSAAQYASSIDEAVALLRSDNNGLYTNDWPMADVRRNETAVYLLGTRAERLWRSGDQPAPFGTPGFLWSNNNARDPAVRREYAVQPGEAPFDPVFVPWDRDLAFRRFWRERQGRIDLKSAVELLSSSPVNRPHAVDGKVTTGALADRLVFVAHMGKTTLREKFPAPGNRRMPDLPGATPHLTLGWATFSPIAVAEGLRAAREAAGKPPAEPAPPKVDVKEVEALYKLDPARLWKGSLFPASEADGAWVSGAAAYWQLLRALGDDPVKGRAALAQSLADLSARWHWVVAREGDLAPSSARLTYDSFAPYRVARIKGTFLFHQLRLWLGNDAFLAGMAALSKRSAGRDASRADLTAAFAEATGRDVAPLAAQWLDREGLPDPRLSATVSGKGKGKGWRVRLEAAQAGRPWRLFGTATIEAGEAGGADLVRRFELDGARSTVEWDVPGEARPARVVLSSGGDFPAPLQRWQKLAHFSDDWSAATVVQGTSRQVEAGHTLALRWQAALADGISETLPPVVKDAELDDEELRRRDLLVLGGPADNGLAARAVARLREAGLDLDFGPGWFRFRGRTHARPDEGLLLSAENPWNPARSITLVAANSAVQLHRMTRAYVPALPAWVLYRGDDPKEQGFHPPASLTVALPRE